MSERPAGSGQPGAPRQPHACLVSTTQPSTNPRLVKEADALEEAGFAVHVVCGHRAEWAYPFDERLLASRRWDYRIVDWQHDSDRTLFWKTRIRHFVARRLAGIRALHPLIEESALSRVGSDLRTPLFRLRPDIFIAHNLGALPAALAAGRWMGVPVGFDAEDFHSGELSRRDDRRLISLTRDAEARLMPQCAYITAASPGIGRAYHALCGVEPVTVLNVFPLRERPLEFRARDPHGPVRLYWFSQTIGPNRGLEDIVRALALLRSYRVELHLRGRWQAGYEAELRGLAARCGVPPGILVSHPPASPENMVRAAAEFDVGLALEPPVTANSDILLSNKIFTYVLAGNAIVATRTRAQAWLASQLDESTVLCDANRPESLAAALRSWLDGSRDVEKARRTAWRLGESRFNWDREKTTFLRVVQGALDAGVSRGLVAGRAEGEPASA